MKLEDVDKKNIHKVPDGYFDELPQMIQSKIADQQKGSEASLNSNNAVRYGLRLALPVAILLMVVGYLTFFKNTAQELSPEEMLAQVSTDEIVLYLEESEITTEEIIESIELEQLNTDFDENTPQFIEGLNEEDLDGFLNDYEDFDEIL